MKNRILYLIALVCALCINLKSSGADFRRWGRPLPANNAPAKFTLSTVPFSSVARGTGYGAGGTSEVYIVRCATNDEYRVYVATDWFCPPPEDPNETWHLGSIHGKYVALAADPQGSGYSMFVPTANVQTVTPKVTTPTPTLTPATNNPAATPGPK